MSAIGKDRILRELLDFFFDEMKRDWSGTADWLAQGEIDIDQFADEARKLRKELELRDSFALPSTDRTQP